MFFSYAQLPLSHERGLSFLRIISGIRRGHKLFEFEGSDIRPTTDRVRESLFNLIQDFVDGAMVLDLFGGSGALSLEAISRGAKNSVICDIDLKSIELIKKNTKSLGFEDKLSINRISAEDFIRTNNKQFDLIFLDPPYNKGFISPIISSIVENGLLNDEGIIVLESDNTDEHGEFSGLSVLKQRRYGRTFVTVYKRGDKI